MIAVAAVAIGLAWYLWTLATEEIERKRGIVFGEPPAYPLPAQRLGINVSLEQYTKEELAAMKTLAIPAGYSKLLAGGSRREKYNNGFWLREKVFLDIKERSGLDGKLLDRLYYTGKIDQLVKEIERIQ